MTRHSIANAPEIYDKNHNFFDESESAPATKKKTKKEKPMFLKDHERMRLETKGTKAFLSDDDDDDAPEKRPMNDRTGRLAFDQEQRELRTNLLKSLHGNDDKDAAEDAAEDGDGEEDAFDDLFQSRVKSDAERAAEEEDYSRWLKEEGASFDPETAKELEPLKRFWTGKGLSDTDKFLRDYLTNRRWKSESDSFGGYSSGPAPNNSGQAREDEQDGVIDLEGDLEDVEQAEEYERSYNFRFEEGTEATEVKTFPRQIDGSLRKKKTKRQNARERASERKEEQKALKSEEIKRLKNLKQQEILDKLKAIKEITGNDAAGLDGVDLEGDFDPDTHEQQMQAVFTEEYYNNATDTTKPQFPDDLGDIPDYEGENDGYDENGDGDWDGPHVEDNDFNMDADYVPMPIGEKKKKKKAKALTRKQLKELEQKLASGELKVDGGDAELHKKLDEYYNLDYEDIVGGIPTRFKYREVLANDYGLSTEELLAAEDKELNRWASLKKMVQYRDESDERRDKQSYKRRRTDIAFKKEVFVNSNAWQVTEKGQAAVERHNSASDKAAKRIKKKLKKEKERGAAGAGTGEGDEPADSAEPPRAAVTGAAVAGSSDDGAQPKKSHKERRKEQRRLLQIGGTAIDLGEGGTSAPAPVKKIRKKAGKVGKPPTLPEPEAPLPADKVVIGTAQISAQRLAAYSSGSAKLDRKRKKQKAADNFVADKPKKHKKKRERGSGQ